MTYSQLCREVLENYTIKMQMLTEVISKAMAKSLNLEENCFLDQFGEQAVLQARFNCYSPCQRPDLVLGLKSHADGSGYTIILQDNVEGLQVLKDERWFTVPTISDALLVLMADQMEVWLMFICYITQRHPYSNPWGISIWKIVFPEPHLLPINNLKYCQQIITGEELESIRAFLATAFPFLFI